MKFENPEIEEGINVSKEHPLKEFWQLSITILSIVLVTFITITLLASFFAKKIPFSYEKKMVEHIDLLKVEASPQQARLQTLADRLARHMDLPDGMAITVHYSDKDVVNAFATLGGNVYFFKGLIERLQSENALAMVMAHEIAHIKHRHPIVAMGKGLTFATLMGSIVGASGSKAGEALIGQSLNIGLLKFSRDQESQSDFTAANAVQAEYGNIAGAEELFEVFSSISEGSEVPEILSSHPHTKGRWLILKNQASLHNWAPVGKLTPLEFTF